MVDKEIDDGFTAVVGKKSRGVKPRVYVTPNALPQASSSSRVAFPAARRSTVNPAVINAIKSSSTAAVSDRVTFCFFCKLTDTGAVNQTELKNQAGNVETICRGLQAAAAARGRDAPEFYASILVINTSKTSSNQTSNNYWLKTASVVPEFRERLERSIQLKIKKIQLERNEINYLNTYHGEGNQLDLIKIRAVLDNADSNHLQLDSTLLLRNVDDFYQQTFGAEDGDPQFILNKYIPHKYSVNNKVTYTSLKNNVFIEQLRTVYYAHIQKICNFNSTINSSTTLDLYDSVYKKALVDAGLIRDPQLDYKEDISRYVRITRSIFPANNGTWSTVKYRDTHGINALLQLPAVRDLLLPITINYAAFTHVLDVYVETRPLNHNVFVSSNDFEMQMPVIRDYYTNLSLEDKKKVCKMWDVPFDEHPRDFLRSIINLNNKSPLKNTLNQYLQILPTVSSINALDLEQSIGSVDSIDWSLSASGDRASPLGVEQRISPPVIKAHTLFYKQALLKPLDENKDQLSHNSLKNKN